MSRRVNWNRLLHIPIHCLPIGVDEGTLINLRVGRVKHNSGVDVERNVREQVIHCVKMSLYQET
jgi:hypothetical protein